MNKLTPPAIEPLWSESWYFDFADRSAASAGGCGWA